MSDCSFPGCANPARAHGLCIGHDQQRRRGQELRPLRGQVALVRLPGLRVRPEVRDRLAATGPTIGEAARAVLERWANGRTK